MIMKFNALLARCNSFVKLARKVDDLATLKANIGKYVHFSNSDRLGINYGGQLHPGNPKAVYGFPLTAAKYEAIVKNVPEAFSDYGYNKYIYIFDVSGNILNMDSIDLQNESYKIQQFVQQHYRSSYHASYIPTPIPYTSDSVEFLRWIGRIAKDLFKNVHSGVNVLLRGIGYDAIETKSGGFGDDINTEIAVLNPSAVNLVAKVNNPMLTKEQLREIDWLQSPEYAAQQAQKQLEVDEQDRQYAESLARHQQYMQEEKDLYQLERKLWKEHKFDEADILRKQFKDKWRDLPKF